MEEVVENNLDIESDSQTQEENQFLLGFGELCQCVDDPTVGDFTNEDEIIDEKSLKARKREKDGKGQKSKPEGI